MIKVTCKYCGRFLCEAESMVATIPCQNSACRAENQIKILTNDTLVAYEFAQPPRPPKQKKENE